MSRFVALISVLAASLAVAGPDAAPPAPTPAKLDAPVSLTLGQLYAVMVCQHFSAVRETFDAPTVCLFNAKTKKVEISIYGRRSRVEDARETLVTAVGIVARFTASMGTGALDDSNSVFIYFKRGDWLDNKGTAPTEVLRKEDGKFFTP
jgi:hypothetical protein